jgi:putative ABC transport system permease protein
MSGVPVSVDVRYTFRALCRSPWYAVAVVAVLALALAVATVAAAVVDGVLFKPLPYHQPHALFVLRASSTTVPETLLVAPHEIAAWREALPHASMTTVRLSPNPSTRGGRERITAEVDEHFFAVLGIRPLLGGFTTDDFSDAWRVQPVVLRPTLISYGVWQREYGGDPAVVGRTVIVRTEQGGRQYGQRIAGVLPRDFVLPVDGREVSGIQPLARSISGSRREYHVVLRAHAESPEVAAQVLLAATTRLAGQEPSVPGGQHPVPSPPFDSLRVVSLQDHLAARERPAFTMVFAASIILLLLASVNVAGLAAARNAGRRADLAIVRALGAGTWAIVRGLLFEVALLATAALGVALLLARPMLAWTVDLLPASVSLLKEPVLDSRVFAEAALFAVFCLAVVVIWPALVATRMNPRLSLQATLTSAPRGRSQMVILASQVALGFVLLTAGGLTLASVAAAYRNDTGYLRDRAVLLEVYAQRPPEGSRPVDVLRSLPAVLGTVPGVQAVAVSTVNPVFAQRANSWTTVVPEGSSKGVELRGVVSRQVTADFFDVLGMRLVDGRWPGSGEWVDDQPVALVSETASRALWPERGAIGQRLVARSDPNRMRTVIGIVADARFQSLDEAPVGDIYLPDPLAETGRTGVFFHVRTSAPASDVLPVLLSVLNGRGLMIEQASTHADALFASVKHRVLPAWLFGSLGLSALVMLCVAVFGLLAMSVGQRRRELGIRLALGASSRRVVQQLVGEQAVAVAVGLLAGALCSVWAVRILESQLYGVDAYDTTVWLGVAGALGTAALAGALLPSLHAVRIDPAVVLRDN